MKTILINESGNNAILFPTIALQNRPDFICTKGKILQVIQYSKNLFCAKYKEIIIDVDFSQYKTNG